MGSELLRKFLGDRGEGQSAFALRAGVSGSALSEWLSGARAPDIYSAKLIEDATGGAVPIVSWARTDKRRHAAPHPPKRVRRRAAAKSAG